MLASVPPAAVSSSCSFISNFFLSSIFMISLIISSSWIISIPDFSKDRGVCFHSARSDYIYETDSGRGQIIFGPCQRPLPATPGVNDCTSDPRQASSELANCTWQASSGQASELRGDRHLASELRASELRAHGPRAPRGSMANELRAGELHMASELRGDRPLT